MVVVVCVDVDVDVVWGVLGDVVCGWCVVVEVCVVIVIVVVGLGVIDDGDCCWVDVDVFVDFGVIWDGDVWVEFYFFVEVYFWVVGMVIVVFLGVCCYWIE